MVPDETRIFQTIIFCLLLSLLSVKSAKAQNQDGCLAPREGLWESGCPQVEQLSENHSQKITGSSIAELFQKIDTVIDEIKRRFNFDGSFKVNELTIPAISEDTWKYIGYTDEPDAEAEHIIGSGGTTTWCVGTEAAHECPACPEGTEPKWYTCLPCCGQASPENKKPAACTPGNEGGFSEDFASYATCCDCKPAEGSTANPLLRLAPPNKTDLIKEELSTYRNAYGEARFKVSSADGPQTQIEYGIPHAYGLKNAFDDPNLDTGIWNWLSKTPSQSENGEASGQEIQLGQVQGLLRTCDATNESLPQTPACFAETLDSYSDEYNIEAGDNYEEPDPNVGTPSCSEGVCSVTVSAGTSAPLNLEGDMSFLLDYFDKSTQVFEAFLPPTTEDQTENTAGEGNFNFSFAGKNYESKLVIPLAGIHERTERLFHQYGQPPTLD
ncbi:MAG: hypothetical protein ACOC6Q_01845 [Patescibacteria group bacterium]